jgi:hypothetical protein
MMIEMSPAEAREEAAANLERLIVAHAAELVMEQATSEVNGWLERAGVAYRVPADDSRLTDAVVELATAHNQAHKRDLAGLADDGGFLAAAVRLNARAMESVQHRILAGAMEQHVKSIESDLVKAVEKYRALIQLGVKHFGEAAADDWLPAPETAALFGVGSC